MATKHDGLITLNFIFYSLKSFYQRKLCHIIKEENDKARLQCAIKNIVRNKTKQDIIDCC